MDEVRVRRPLKRGEPDAPRQVDAPVGVLALEERLLAVSPLRQLPDKNLEFRIGWKPRTAEGGLLPRWQTVTTVATRQARQRRQRQAPVVGTVQAVAVPDDPGQNWTTVKDTIIAMAAALLTDDAEDHQVGTTLYVSTDDRRVKKVCFLYVLARWAFLSRVTDQPLVDYPADFRLPIAAAVADEQADLLQPYAEWFGHLRFPRPDKRPRLHVCFTCSALTSEEEAHWRPIGRWASRVYCTPACLDMDTDTVSY
jgi:hypothetical protein